MTKKFDDIAIVGMSCIFPGAKDLETYWNNILSKKSAIKIAPSHRVPAVFYDKAAGRIDRHSVNMGGFIDEYLEFDPIEFGMVPNAIQGTEADHLVALKLTKTALEDAGVFEKNISLENAGIIIGKGSFGGLEMLKVNEIVVGGENIKNLVGTLCPSLTEEELESIKRNYQAQFGNFNSQNIMGTVPNLVASLVANRFNFGGPAYTLDAACASSLLAVENGVRELHSGRCDIVVVGAMHLAQSPSMFSFFETLGALSKNQDIRPFDKNADGVLTGEGCAFVVLKKLSDAKRARDRIYAVIKGVGISSDGSHASVMSPSTLGQVKAVRRAWEMAQLDSSQVGYVEAHGTGTKLGDKTELQTLKEAFPHRKGSPKAGLGSVKAMIGHAMAAAGMAGFIKTVMALYKGVIPPTINCTHPLDAMDETHFRTLDEPLDWKNSGLPMLAGVNAFGFGGANAHVVLEHFPQASSTLAEDKVVLLARSSVRELIRAIKEGDFSLGEGAYRLAVFNPTENRLSLAIRILEKGIDWRGKQDIWFTGAPLLAATENKLAFMFPGLDIPALEWLDEKDIVAFANHFDFPVSPDLSRYLETDKARVLEKYQILIDSKLKQSGVTPDVVAGHSLGEWTACAAIGLVDSESIEALNQSLVAKDILDLGDAFLSVNCSAADIHRYLAEEENYFISNDNCYQQIVISVAEDQADRINEKLTSQGIISHRLPFSTGYHSPFAQPLVESATHSINNVLKFSLPQIPIWSSISARQYPASVDAIKKLHMDFVTSPVLFRQMVDDMYAAGVRCFLQIGNGALTGFIANILADKPHMVVSSGTSKRSTLSQLMRVAAALYVEGREIDMAILDRVTAATKIVHRKGLNAKVDVSYPFVNYQKVFDRNTIQKADIQGRVNEPSPSNYRELIMASLADNLARINKAQSEFLHQLPKAEFSGTKRDVKRSITISLEEFPFLIDHCPFKKRSITDNFDHEQEPIVPFTFFIDLLIEVFSGEFPTLLLVAMTKVKVHQFLWVNEPRHFELRGHWLDESHIQFSIDGVFEATVQIASGYLPAFKPETIEAASEEPPVLASEIYSEGYMFHGPSYQGIQDIISYSEKALETRIKGVSVKGAMLDNLGQTNGLFNHFSGKSLRSFPVAVERIDFFQNPLDQLGTFNCRCYTVGEDQDYFYSNIELMRDGKAWCKFYGWQTKKSDLDHEGWSLLNRVEGKGLAKPLTEGIFVIDNTKYKQANTWFILSHIYLNQQELNQYRSLPVAKQKDRLLGRIAAKDAIRDLLMKREGRVTHPAAFTISNNSVGCPEVIASAGLARSPVNVSIAHKQGIAVAKAASGKAVGIDIEEIKPRDAGFIDMVISPDERKFLPVHLDLDEWITRVWVAKEAYGKSIGKGLQGSPKNYLLTAVRGDELFIENVGVRTLKYKQKIIGWTQ